MKVSLNLAQQYSNVDLKSIPRDELLKRIGAQLGAVEDVTDWAPKFEGAVIVKVVECVKHDGADKLSVCRVDDGGKNPSVERGEDGLIQVVCGAPNVREGMHAVWLAPGVIVPASRETDPFVLEAREIRGVVSNGMMASPSELGISDSHDGLLDVSEENPAPGDPLTNYFGLDDFVIDCENKMFTHRPDCFGNLGVARELAGIFGLKFESPSWYRNIEFTNPSSKLTFRIENEIEDLVPRFAVQVVEGVKIQPSPLSMQALLTRVGIKPINNIVDLTNYYMHLTAQPTHAYDYDKLKALSGGDEPVLLPRKAQAGETLTLLGGKTIKLTEDDIVIATDQKAVGLAGIMGGAETEVDENTKNILIEAATFDMYAIRRSSMRHGLFTDASTRFNKGQSSFQNTKVQLKLVSDICQQTGAIAGVGEETHLISGIRPVTTTVDFINQRLGSTLSGEEMKQLLENVEFIVDLVGNELRIEQPFWRTDVELAEDVVEEIGRLYGYDKLPVTLPPRSSKPTPKNSLFEYKQQLRLMLKEAGANEVLTYSFVHGDLLRKTGTNPETSAHHLRNAISPDLQYYRTTLLPSLISKIHSNIKAQAGASDNQFALFEIGKTHIKGREDDEKLPLEMEHIALTVTADDKTAKTNQSGAAYYLAKKYVDLLTGGRAEYEPIKSFEYPMTSVFAPGRSAVVKLDGELVGVVGEYNPSVRSSLKLPEFSAGLELDIVRIERHQQPIKYEPLPEFPGTTADITLEVSGEKTFAELSTDVKKLLAGIVHENGYRWDIKPGDIFVPDGTSLKRITLRVQLSHPEKTLRTEEAVAVIDELAKGVEALGARKV